LPPVTSAQNDRPQPFDATSQSRSTARKQVQGQGSGFLFFLTASKGYAAPKHSTNILAGFAAPKHSPKPVRRPNIPKHFLARHCAYLEENACIYNAFRV